MKKTLFSEIRFGRSTGKAGFLLFTILVFLALLLSCQQEKEMKSVSVADFGAVPNDSRNDAEALQKAIDYCRKHPGTALHFESGIYNFRDEKAVDLQEGILNGEVKGNPQDSIFRPYYPYAKGLDFAGLNNITLEAQGAILLFEGWGEPVSLNNCTNITVKGLTIDYKTKPHVEGTIVSIKPDWYEAVFDSIYHLTDKMPLCRVHYFDTRAHRLLSEEDYFPRFEFVAPRILRIFRTIDPGMLGYRIMSPQTFHFRPAILMLEAKNIRLDGVTIHSQPGMGIVGHRSENILMNGLRIVPLSGQRMSTNTDATHFTSCKGYIRYLNCQFEGHGDDAVNIHNYYLTIREPSANGSYNLVLEGADWHAQVLDFPDVADTMELVRRQTLKVVKKLVVKTVENNMAQLYSHVSFDELLPSDLENYYIINVTRLPRVEIIGCSVMSNRSRGFLIKTRNVLIENNLIRESTGSGIHVGAEGDWHEGPASENVTIRNNRILRCGISLEGIDWACGITVNVGAEKTDVVGLHKHLLIEGNIIEGDDAETGIFISGAENVLVRNNEISGCKKAIRAGYSEDVRIFANRCSLEPVKTITKQVDMTCTGALGILR
ncbi:right-handed parallel beta-helix repeat-containing protein [Gaoshiqia sp. Z1-71]|uniref:right-handed parallel beta-helix repeat-containing protein n=1 Tax=Gaoshiqia hydrogeniformans TaxID=3290090 RepID=UPI003BF8FFF3